jgi:hypothetical protein
VEIYKINELLITGTASPMDTMLINSDQCVFDDGTRLDDLDSIFGLDCTGSCGLFYVWHQK